MDWRCFLSLLVITVQPTASYLDHLHWSFAFYSSYGDLDLNCADAVPLGVVKAFMSFPVLVPLRERMRELVQAAWEEVRVKPKLLSDSLGDLKADPDENPVSLQLFQKMLRSGVFRIYDNKFTPFGRTGEFCL